MSNAALCIIGVILLAFTWLALRGMVSEEKRRRTLPPMPDREPTPIASHPGHTHELRG